MDNKNREHGEDEGSNSRSANKSTSLGTLIAWNMSKALEKSPHIDVKCAIKAAQARLERDVNVVISQCPEERHMECAVLAWQQLGHSDTDSLYKFYETKKGEQEHKASILHANKINEISNILDVKPTTTHKEIITEKQHTKATKPASFSLYSMGPVVKLPVQPKLIMRMEHSGNVRQTCKIPKTDEKNIMNKIDEVCCLDSGCIERLSILDATTSELRLRAAKLAQREAERAELLERAEAAWKNLELGYHRRLTLAEEKEDDISKQIQKLIEERNNYKTVCTTLVQYLKERAEAAEKERGKLTEVEKSVYDRACVRHRLGEQVAKGESALAEQHCRGAQVDRDLQFKQEEARRKLRNMESELESIRALTHDTERAMRSELGAIKVQVTCLSQQLLSEDADSCQIKQELKEIQLEKMGIVEDLDGCKLMCDSRMQGRMDELKKKKQQLNDLKEKVIECRCKFPIDATVEVKRTASLAALCHCTPEEKILESCSCSSLRSQLLSNLLADLFGGLLNELGWTGSQMTCQLLKCLEDKHNWDRASVLKTNLRSFFARLLIGELDIAIATSIEKYHAKWVGATCADVVRIIPDTRTQVENAGWQERAMERRAQKLATKLAEQLFEERADQLTQRAKEIVTSGPPPCECRPQTALYPCILKPPEKISTAVGSKSGEGISHNWRHALSDFTQLRLQVESLKKDSIKKVDLKTMEDNIAKLVERNSVLECPIAFTPATVDTTVKSPKALNIDYSARKRKPSVINSPKNGNKKISNMKFQMDKSAKSCNKLKQTFAVNLCLCRTQAGAYKKVQPDKRLQDTNLVQNNYKNSYKQKPANVSTTQIASLNKYKPITAQLSTTVISNEKQMKTSTNTFCKKDCACFHKKPSNTSIDKLLDTIAKWKMDLTDSSPNQDKNSKIIKNAITSSEKSIKDKTNSKASLKFDQESEIKIKSTRKSSSKNNGRSNEGQRKVPENLQIIAKATESEYVGAVNLDKSHESICKCDNYNKSNDSCEIPNKCLISLKECCGRKSSAKSTILSESPLLTELPIIGSNDDSGPKPRVDKSKSIENELPSNNGDQNQAHPIETSDEVFLCDCDIMFLGVTLADKKTNKQKKTHANKGGYSDDDSDTRDDCNRKNVFYNNKTKKSRRRSRKNNLDDLTISCNKTPTCSCQDKFNEMEDVFAGICNKPKDAFIFNIDKGDVINTVESEPKREGCICCNINDKVESKNLEENTFQLLKEHVKEKLDEFKTTSCKSSCIPPEEEEKLFSILIYKVKQIILDTSNNVSCKCSSSKAATKGSWNRAYSLLQEYLKTKINRVQCHCTSKENPSPIETVLDKVNKLIEHDFERLKSICKCKNMNNMYGTNAVKRILSEEEIPVKDVEKPQTECYLGNNEMHNTFDSEKLPEFHKDSLKSVNLTENISAQVPLNLGMESKSCNAIEKDSVNIQTSEITKIHLAYNDCGSTMSKSNCDCCCDVLRKTCVPMFKEGATEVLVTHCRTLAQEHYVKKFLKYGINSKSYSYPGLDPTRCTSTASEYIKKEKINNETNTCNEYNTTQTTHLPYVGYTVDCCCDINLGACVCMKSIVQANSNKYVDMWKTYIDYSKMLLQNVSYIMKSKTDKLNVMNDTVLEETQIVAQLSEDHRSKHDVCEVKLSAQVPEEITLKDSRNNIEGVHSVACAVTDNCNIEKNCLVGKDLLDWCECSSRPVKISYTDQYDKIMCSRVSSDVFEGSLVDDIVLNPLPRNCNCDVVPICHVKMLVDSIENKLLQSSCTCDSLGSVVCPIHSA